MQRQAPAVAGDDVARIVQPLDLDLQALDRGVDVAHRAAAARLLAQHVPRLERLAQFELDAALGDRRRSREAELEMRREPLGLEAVAAPTLRSSSTSVKSCQTKCGSMKSSCRRVPQRLSALLVGPVPEGGDQAAQRAPAGPRSCANAAASRRRAAPADRAGRRRVSGVNSLSMQNSVRCVLPVRVDQEVAEDAVDQPGRRLAAGRDLAEGDLELVQRDRCAPRRCADAGWSGR